MSTTMDRVILKNLSNSTHNLVFTFTDISIENTYNITFSLIGDIATGFTNPANWYVFGNKSAQIVVSDTPYNPVTTVTLGSGATTNSYLPIYTFYGYNLTQTIYTAAEMIAGGASSSGGIITKIRFKPTFSAATTNWKDWDIYLINSNKVGFSSTSDWIPVSSMTKVYHSTIVANTVANTWMEIQLTDLFVWDGVSNLVVCVHEKTPAYGSSGQNWASYTLAPSSGSKALYKYQDSPEINPLSPPTGTTVNSVAQIQFDIEPATGCYVPNNTHLVDMSLGSATLAWTPLTVGSPALSYDYELRVMGAAGSGATGLIASASNYNNTQVVFNNLNPGTSYTFYLRTNCSSGSNSDWSNGFGFTAIEYTAVEVTGFTADVVANGIGNANASTTHSVDNASSDYALVAQDFQATTSSPTPVKFLPNNRIIANGAKYYTLANYSANNSLRLEGANKTGTLEFATPIAAEKVYVLGVSGSAVSILTAEVFFTDASTQTFAGLSFPDWFATSGNIVAPAIGRVKRTTNAIEAGTGPSLFEDTLTLSSSNVQKEIEKIVFTTASNSTGIMNIMAISVKASNTEDCDGIPNPGIASSTLTQVCPNVPFTLSVINANPLQNGITYHWQQSPAGENNWTNISGAELTSLNIPSGITSNTDYRFAVTCSFSSETAYSNIVNVTVKPYTECYCIPTGAANNSDEIVNFTLSNLNNTTPPNQGVNGYSDYTQTVAPANLIAGNSYTASLRSGAGSGNHGAAIWIDYNNNGIFDTNEKVSYIGLTIPANTTVNFPIFTAAAYSGVHRLRVMYVYNQSGQVLTPCSTTTTFSEIEDYLVNITIPECLPPTGANIISITSNTANITWISPNSDGIEVFYSTSSTNPDINTTPQITLAGNSTGTLITGLTEQTTYYLWLRSNCGANGFSNWSGPLTFTTTCQAVTEFTQNWDGVSSTSFPNCFYKVGSAGSVNLQTTNPYSAPNTLYIYASSTSNEPTFALQPVSNAGANTHWLKFMLRASGTVGGVLQVGYLTDPNNASSFVLIQEVVATSLNYEEKFVDPGTMPGTNQVLAFRAKGTPANSMLIDNLVWEQKPSCMKPTNLNVQSASFNNATVGWTASTSNPTNGYDLYWSTSNAPISEGTVPLANVPSGTNYNLNSLNPASTYYLWVRSNCGSGSVSFWIGPITFNTLICNPANQCVYTFTLLDSYGDGWNGNSIDITQNGILVQNLTLTGGSSANFNVSLCPQLNTNIVFHSGSYPDEISFSIKTPWNETIHTSNTGSLSSANNNQIIYNWFSACSEPTCHKPINLSVSNITNNSAVINWAEANQATEWEVIYGAPGFNPMSEGTLINGLNITSHAISSLNTSTAYQAYVRAVCSVDDKSDWAGPVSFTTTQIPANMPFIEDFETWPNGWSVVNGSQTNKWYVGTAVAHTGSHSAYISSDNGVSNTYNTSATSVVHIYRDIQVPVTSFPLNLKFNWKCVGETVDWDRMRVYLAGTNNIPIAGTELTNGQIGLENYNNANTWQVANIDLASASYSGQIIRLVFSWRNDGSGGTPPPIAIDDIEFTVVTCPKPIDLTKNNLNENSVEIIWAENGSSTEWELVYGVNGFNPMNQGTLVSGLNTTSYNITGLTASTTYQAYVRSVCSSTETSSWAGPVTFTTLCTANTTYPYLQSFGATIPNCWFASEGVSGASYHWEPVTADASYGANAPQAGTHFMRLYVYLASTTYNPYYLTTEPFNLSGANKLLSYYYFLGSGGYTTTPVPLTLQISTNGGSTWTDLYAHTTANSTFSSTGNGWTKNVVDLAAYAGQNVIFRFKSNSNYGSGRVDQGIDEFEIYDAPTCMYPTALTVSNITFNTTLIGWTASTSNPSDGYEVYYSENNTNPDASTTGLVFAPANQTTATISGLNPSTIYYVWVRSNCGSSDLSEWEGPLSFTTTQIPAAIPYNEDFETWPNGWTVVNGTQTNKWFVGTAVANSGNQAAYISDNNGVSNTYNVTTSSVVHLYRDFANPFTGNELPINIQFKWKGVGESTIDRLRVYFVSTAITPVAGTELTSGQIGLTNYNQNAAWTEANIELPSGAFTNPTMRLVFSWRNDASVGTQPPIAIDNIEISIITCPKPINLNITNMTETEVTVAWDENGDATEWEFVYGEVGFNPDTEGTLVQGLNLTSYSFNYSGTYQAYARSVCGAGDYSDWAGPLNISYYCTPQSTNSTYYINNFSTTGGIQNISNMNSGYSTGGYGIFTNLIVEQEVGGSVGFTASYSSTYTYGFRIWVDWNHNGQFEASEVVYSSSSYQNSHNGSFIVPQNLPSMTTRMRIANHYLSSTGDVNPCQTGFTNGEFEDYTFIVYNPNFCAEPTNLIVNNITANSASLVWTAANPAPQGYNIYFSTSATAPDENTTPSASVGQNETSYQLTNLAENTVYYAWVRSVCGNNLFSDWSQQVTFTTLLSLSTETDILTYSFGALDHEPAVINNNNKTVNVILIEGTNLNGLVANFTLSDGATATVGGVQQQSGVTPNNFQTGSKIYTVTAEDGVTATDWTVNVQVFVGINTFKEFGMKILPNPNTGKFTLYVNHNNDNCRYELTDVSGRVILTKQLEGKGIVSEYFDLNLAPGSYFLRLISGDNIQTQKLVIE